MIAIVAVIIVVLAGVYFFYSKISTPLKSERFLSSYNEALALNSIYGKEDEAIKKFEEALSLAPNAEASANITLMIAINLYIRNRGNDRVEAISLLKDIIKNSNLSVQRRAAALNGLALVVSNNGIDNEFVKKYLFNDEPYTGYFSQTNGDTWRATRRIFEEADKLYPSISSKTNIAFMLAVGIYDHGKAEPGISKENTARLIQKYIADSAVTPDDPSFSYTDISIKADIMTKKAVALGVSELILHNISQNDIEAAYKQAIDAADSDSSVLLSQIGIFARFNYAIYLADTFSNSRKNDILLLLQKIMSDDGSRYQNFYRHLGVIASYPNDSLLKIATIKLANLSPDFRAFLTRYGWSF